MEEGIEFNWDDFADWYNKGKSLESRILHCSMCNREKEDDGYEKCDDCHNLINPESK
ncbi:MAG: hypothetical protein ACWA5P_01740 [bacterium]